MKWIKNNLLNLYIISNILFIFITSYYVKGGYVEYSVFGRNIINVLILNGIVLFGLLIYKIVKKTYKIKIYDLLLLGMIIMGGIASIFALKPLISIFGFPGRYEGYLSILYYFSLFMLCSFVKREDKKKIINIILFTGLFHVFYSYLQLHDNPSVTITRRLGVIWATGLTYNPNFFGSYMILCLGYALGLFIEADNKKQKIIFGIILSVLYYGLLISNTTSCMIALILIAINITIYLIKKKEYEKLLILIILFIFISVTVMNLDQTTLFKDLIKTKNETVEIVKGNINDSFGTKRIKVWRKTMEVVPKYLVHGAGIDSYYYIFGKEPLFIGRFFYDKAHNEYLQILVTQGIFSLIFYLLFYLVIVLRGIKGTKERNSMYLLLPVAGYLIQAFFNISVIEVASIFFIALGLLVDREDNISIYNSFIKRFLDILFSMIFIILLLPLFIIIFIIIKIGDRDKVFYAQIRTGRDGREFKIYKFRTMSNKKITGIGKVLRKISLDELPQLINIIKGDMSFVGPRPWIVDYYKLFNKKQKNRVSVRPGITGLAQVNGRNSINVFKKIEYDLEYVENMSFLMDLKIVIKSIKVVFTNNEEIDMDKNIKKELEDLKKKKTK